MPTPSPKQSLIADRRRLLTAIAVVLGVGELADAFFISFWEGAVVFGIPSTHSAHIALHNPSPPKRIWLAANLTHSWWSSVIAFMQAS